MKSMAYLKKYYSVAANSILESVIALCIISVCLYVAVLVYATVFTPKTAPKFYGSKNRLAELFYMAQINPDSISSITKENLLLNQEWINVNLQQLKIEYKDSSGVTVKNNFYIQSSNE